MKRPRSMRTGNAFHDSSHSARARGRGASQPRTGKVGRSLQKQIKIIGLETDLLRLPPAAFTGDAIHDVGSAAGGSTPEAILKE
jgi:hypothetical protein